MRGIVSAVSSSAVVRRQHVSAKAVAIRNRYVRRIVLLLTAAAIVAIAFVWTRVKVIQLGYEVTRLHRDVAQLTEQRLQREAELGRLTSPDRLERVARERLGMRLPQGNEIVFVTSERGEDAAVSDRR